MTNRKILVVDDDTDLRETLKISMENSGFDVLEAIDGESGLALALSSKPDLILLDITMPKMNGLQMLHTLRKDAWGKDVPVLLLTNADDPTHIVRGVELKSNDYLIKSQTSLETIVKTIRQQFIYLTPILVS